MLPRRFAKTVTCSPTDKADTVQRVCKALPCKPPIDTSLLVRSVYMGPTILKFTIKYYFPNTGISLILVSIIYFTTLYDWFKKLAPPTQPIRCKIKTNRDLATRVFPRLAPVMCICSEFSLVHFVTNISTFVLVRLSLI